MAAGDDKNDDFPYHDDMLKKMAARLRAVRKAKGYPSSEVFAYTHNINRTQYGRYERGKDIRFTSLVRVLKALDISLIEFFSEGFES